MDSIADRARARLRRTLQLIEATEYYAVGGSPRYLAVQRRRTRAATRAALLVMVVVAAVNIPTLSLLHPAAFGYVLQLNITFGGAAFAVWWALAHQLRRRPEPVAFVMGLLALASVIAVAVGGPRIVDLAIAYVMVLPTVVAMVVPWRTWTEARWLLAYASIATVFIVAVDAPTLSAIDRSDLVVALLLSVVASFVGHVLLFRDHVITFTQMESVARLHRSENSQRIELERVYRSLEITARTDELTRVGNRMKLEEDLVAVRARMGRTGRPIGLLELDLDHFKAVNDELGHLAGDAVLRAVARAVRHALRADDMVFRYGGEEFLVILGSIAGGIEAAGERLRIAVEDLGLVHPGNPPFGVVTISVGGAALGPADLDETADEWFARVDAALYAAKDAGRNRVAVADGLTMAAGSGQSARPDHAGEAAIAPVPSAL